MRIGYIPPMPTEVFSTSPHEVENLWSVFALQEDRSAWLQKSHEDGFKEGGSVWARCLYAYSLERELQVIYFPEPGVPQEMKAALALLQKKGVTLRPFHFPLLRSPERLQGALNSLCQELEVDSRALKSALDQWSHVRVALRRFDSLQHKNAAFTSTAYVNALRRAMNPGRDIEGHRREIERQILEFEGARQGRWSRVGFIGLTPYRAGLYKVLDECGAVVVYDEWGLENNPQGAAQDLVSHYHQSSLPYGLKRREERLLKEVAERRLRGLILGVECLYQSIREEGYFRAALPVPVFTLDNCRGDGLHASEEEPLRRFLGALASGAA